MKMLPEPEVTSVNAFCLSSSPNPKNVSVTFEKLKPLYLFSIFR